MKTLEQLAREAGLDAFNKLRDPPIPCFSGTQEQLARFRAACRAEALEEAAQRVDALDCAHKCGVGKEISAAILELK